MKKSILLITLTLGLTFVYAQKTSTDSERSTTKVDYSLTIKENKKNEIDWKSMKNFFDDEKANDSIQISVKIINDKINNVNSEKKYSVTGIKRNVADLIELLKKLVND